MPADCGWKLVAADVEVGFAFRTFEVRDGLAGAADGLAQARVVGEVARHGVELGLRFGVPLGLDQEAGDPPAFVLVLALDLGEDGPGSGRAAVGVHATGVGDDAQAWLAAQDRSQSFEHVEEIGGETSLRVALLLQRQYRHRPLRKVL